MRAPAQSAESLLTALETDRARGLTAAQVRERQVRYGPNELPEAPPEPRWRHFLRQFEQLVIGILIAAAVIAGLLGEWIDTLAILAIVLLNGILGFLQEARAERALAALRKLSAPVARVLRDGVLLLLPARELVPGDRIELEAGDHIPADARLLEAFGLRVQEAALTGESTPVDKDAHAVLDEAVALGNRRNMVYQGTLATAGQASAIVVAIGTQTELGHIAGLLGRTPNEPTPLQRRLSQLGRILAALCLSIVGIIFILQLLRGGGLLEVFLLAVSLAVAAVPEGLPAVVTVALALGLQRMVRRHALIRRLPSVETLGSVTVICSDKTGTLTRNEMTVSEVVVGAAAYRVTGAGYAPRGAFVPMAAEAPIDPRRDADLMRLLEIGIRCNNARLTRGPEDEDRWQLVGDPTEGALLVAAAKAGVDVQAPSAPVLLHLPFDSERKAMSVVTASPAGLAIMYTKGAPEAILDCAADELHAGQVRPLAPEGRAAIARQAADMADRALRVLALAYRPFPDTAAGPYRETDLIFVGLVGMIDPPREEARAAVRKCLDAGIRPVMITGDHPATAQAIARQLGLASEADRVVTGSELDNLSDEALAGEVERIAVYARVSAEHKLRVVRAWQACGQVVAMTGDGVNDAPAIKAADIGIAMGVTGTDVTKEASDLVLTDDNFASIVNAVEEGRGIYDNIQKVLFYLLASNTSEVLFMFCAALLGWPVPLLAIQVLWINLVSDGFPALALGMEPPERDLMRRPPRPPHEPVITWERGRLMLLYGLLMAVVALLGFAVMYRDNVANLDAARTVAFCTMAYSQLFYALACRSLSHTMPELGLFSNPPLFAAIALSGILQAVLVLAPFARPVSGTTMLEAWQWGLILGLALTPVTLIETAKLVRAGLRRSG
ncbi:MAG: cation-translocating P-type ATPase [Planctomycetia bacterium]|nr:cation-translocating P-type ATPase [Planctomycetia bacterium]